MNTRTVAACSALLAGVLASPGRALPQSPTLLVDLETSTDEIDGRVSVGGVAGGRLWMSAVNPGWENGIVGYSLATLLPGETEVLGLVTAEALNNTGGRSLREVTELSEGRFALRLGDSSSLDAEPSRLTVSDGTPEGTFGLDISMRGSLVQLGSLGFFIGSTFDTGWEIWRTDGTVQGTYIFEDLSPGPDSSLFGQPDGLAATSSHVFYTVRPEGTQGVALRSIGLQAQSSTRIETAPGPVVFSGVAFGRELLLAWDAGGSPGLGAELYASDGTVGGIRLVEDIAPGAASSDPRAMGAGVLQAYFAADDAFTGRELWSTDGATAQQVVDLAPGPADGVSVPKGSTAVLGDLLLFLGDDGLSGREPWVSDGTPTGTTVLLDAPGAFSNSTISRATAALGKFFFTLRRGADLPLLFCSDGTPAGTQPLGTRVPESSGAIAEWEGQAWLGAQVPPLFVGEQELWSSDGTPEGTAQAVDVGKSAFTKDSNPFAFRGGEGVVWFFATVGGKRTLFTSDGTAAGTWPVVVSDFPSGGLWPIVALGAGLVYGREDSDPPEQDGLWFSSGVVGEEVQLREGLQPESSGFFSTAVVLGGRAYFTAEDAQGIQLWSTDGTAAGTVRVDAVTAGLSTLYQSLRMKVVGERVVLAARFGSDQAGLWFTDGSEAGTSYVPLSHFGAGLSFYELEPFGDQLYLMMETTSGEGELWISDGTVAGTTRVETFGELTYGSLEPVGSTLIVADQTSFYALDPGGAIQTLLTLSQGSLGGLLPGAEPLPLAYISVYQGSATQTGLWMTDGTPAGTQRLSEGYAYSAAPFGDAGHAIFRQSSVFGQQPHITDGTQAGTGLLVQMNPEGNGSDFSLNQGARAGDVWLYRGSGLVVGTELHALSISAAGGFVRHSYGLGCGIGARPELTLGGEPRLGEPVSLDVAGAEPFAPVFYLLGLGSALQPIDGCSLLVANPGLLITGHTDATNAASVPLQIPDDPLLLGRAVYLQAAIGAVGGPVEGAFELTSGLELVFGS